MPVPGKVHHQGGNLAILAHELQGFTSRDSGTEPQRARRAVAKTKEEAKADLTGLRDALAALKAEAAFESWLAWNVSAVWPEHCQRLRGLTDSEFVAEAAAVLEIDPAEVLDLNEQALSSKLPEGRLDLARDLYVTSILLRGRYYGLTKAKRNQAFCHRVRSWPQYQTEAKCEPTPAEVYFVRLLVLSAYREPPGPGRLAVFAQAAKNGRDRRLDARLSETGPEALKRAIEVARDVELRFESWMEEFVAAAILVGVPAIIAYVTKLEFLESLAVAGATDQVSRTKTGKKILYDSLNPAWRLARLASGEPGLVRRLPGGLLLRA